MRRWPLALLLTCLAVVPGCGGESADEAPSGPPGTYVLDVGHWRTQAEADAGMTRWADLANQATGADPVVEAPAAEGGRTERPPMPEPWDEMSEEAQAAFREKALAYVAAEAAGLVETLEFAEDGTFTWTHASTAADGGSVSLGLHRALVSRGTWKREGDALTLQTIESGAPGGATWQVDIEIAGSIEADGAIRIEGGRDAFRQGASLYRRR